MARNISDERLAELWAARIESRRGEWTPEQFDEACEHLGKGICRAEFFAGARAVLRELGYRQVATGMVTLDIPVKEKGGFIRLEGEE